MPVPRSNDIEHLADQGWRRRQHAQRIQAGSKRHDPSHVHRARAEFQAMNAAIGSRNAHRPHGVGAERGIDRASGDGGGRSAGRPAGAVARMGRVLAAAEMRIVGRGPKRAFIHHETAEQHGPGRPQRRDNRRVRRRGPVRPAADTGGPGLPRDGDVGFDPDDRVEQRSRHRRPGAVPWRGGVEVLAEMPCRIEPGNSVKAIVHRPSPTRAMARRGSPAVAESTASPHRHRDLEQPAPRTAQGELFSPWPDPTWRSARPPAQRPPADGPT